MILHYSQNLPAGKGGELSAGDGEESSVGGGGETPVGEGGKVPAEHAIVIWGPIELCLIKASNFECNQQK